MAAYGVKLGIDVEAAMKIGNSFGGGMGLMGGTCGAVTGAFIIIGLKHGQANSEDKESKKKTYELIEKFVREFKSRNDTIICRELIGFDIGSKNKPQDSGQIISEKCPNYIRDAAELIEEIMGH